MSDYEAELGGVLLTCDGDDDLSIKTFAGLGGPEVTQQFAPWSSRDGSTPLGGDRLPSRQIVLEALIHTGTAAAAMEARKTLLAAWGPVRSGMVTLRLRLAGVDYEVDGRPGKIDVEVKDLIYGVLKARLPFTALDPRLYLTAGTSSVSIGLGALGGFLAPITFPYAASAGSTSPQDAGINNVGTFETPWMASITGPVTTPKVILADTAEFVELNGVVPAGSTLVLDSRARTILLDGSPRPSWLTLPSKWWLVPAGASTVRFRAVAGSGICTFSWRSACL